MASNSPTDQMFERMNQSAFACVPRDLVEAYREAKATGNLPEQRDAADELAEAALDDID